MVYGLSKSVAICFLMLLGSFLYAQEAVQPPSEIRLDPTAKDDPRIEFLRPPAGSADTLELGPNGIVVKQGTDTGANANHLGFKLKSSAKTDFLMMLDFEVKSIQPPFSGWGQGILVRIVPEDAQLPAVAVGYAANENTPGAFCYSMNHTDAAEQNFQFEPMELTKGSWILERKNQQLILSIDESGIGSYRMLKRIPCPEFPVKEIQVLCTRQNSGNTPAEYLLKRIQWIGDDYFGRPHPKPPFFTFQRVRSIAFWLAILGGVIYVVQGVRSGKIPIRRP